MMVSATKPLIGLALYNSVIPTSEEFLSNETAYGPMSMQAPIIEHFTP